MKKPGTIYEKFEQLLMYVPHAVEQMGRDIQVATRSHNPIFTLTAGLHLRRFARYSALSCFENNLCVQHILQEKQDLCFTAVNKLKTTE